MPPDGEDRPRQDTRNRLRQDDIADRLPAARPQPVGTIAILVRNTSAGLLGRNDHDRQDQQPERHGRGDQDARREADPLPEERETEQSVDDRGHAGEVRDVDVEQSLQHVNRAFLQRDP
ncbi:MAG: hypothetical protein ACI8VE_002998, partial [Natrialbaceae archaeon]